eukprot:gene22111-biopygen10224
MPLSTPTRHNHDQAARTERKGVRGNKPCSNGRQQEHKVVCRFQQVSAGFNRHLSPAPTSPQTAEPIPYPPHAPTTALPQRKPNVPG